MGKTELHALYLSGTYCHKTGTRPISCAKPQQLVMYLTNSSCGNQSFFTENSQLRGKTSPLLAVKLPKTCLFFYFIFLTQLLSF